MLKKEKTHMKKVPESIYVQLLAALRKRISQAQVTALQRVNKELIAMYWDIGKLIVERQEQEGWGQNIVDRLSSDLQSEFSGQLGFSRRNLYNIREFYLAYRNDSIVQPLVAQIAWSHNILILQKCKTVEERKFYLLMTEKFCWSKSILAMQIQSKAHKKIAKAQHNFSKALSPKSAAEAALAIKDEYTFDFLALEPEHSERELELALISRVGKFLTIMGSHFTYVGSQYHLTVGNQDFYIDLLLFHRGLRSLVAIELKVTDFKPEYAGKMQFYLSALNASVRLPDESPAIGIILCREKNRTIVEYALAESRHPVGVASYKISTKLPKELMSQLPSATDIELAFDAVEPEKSKVQPPVALLKNTAKSRKKPTVKGPKNK